MLVEILTNDPDEAHRNFIKITFDGRQQFYVEDGDDSADNTLAKGFCQCYMIKGMLEKVHELGLKGEPIEFKYIQV
jgi:hypothetical protein